MASTRDLLAAECKIGKVSFFATGCSSSGEARRIAKYTGVGVDGAYTEDLGSEARTDSITATVDEVTYLKLRAVKNAGKVVEITHPLFGTYQGRLVNIEFQANVNDMVDVTLSTIEHGLPSIIMATALSTGSAAQNTKSAYDNLGLDDLDGLATPDLSDSIGNMQSSWTSFDSVLDAAMSGDVLFDEMAAAFNDIATAGQDLIDAVDSAYNDIVDLVEYPIQEGVYDLIDSARDVVNSLERQAGDVWQNFQTQGSVSVAELALEFLGSDSDESIQRILDRNPQIIDVSALVPGVALSIPVV